MGAAPHVLGPDPSQYRSSLVMTPASTPVAAGTTLQFQIAIGWSDGAWHPATTSFTATGGTITIDRLYSAGSVIGTFAVLATCSCGAVDTSLVSVTVGTTPVLTVFQLSPTDFFLAPGASQQLGISYAWSNGDITAPLVSYSPSAGSVSPEGL